MQNILSTLAQLVRHLHTQGHNPATSGNYSHRDQQNDQIIWMSRSGVDKSEFGSSDFLPVDLSTKQLTSDFPQKNLRPSDETDVHLAIYELDPSVGCVLHSHHPEFVMLGEILVQDNFSLLENFELLKAFKGIKTHEAQVAILNFANTQNIQALADHIKETWKKLSAQYPIHAIMLRRHGVYLWGDSVSGAKRSLEAMHSIAKLMIFEQGLRGLK